MKDTAGTIHEVSVLPNVTGFLAWTQNCDARGNGTTRQKAVDKLLEIINDNLSYNFDCEPQEKQEKVLAWIQQHFRKGVQGNAKRYSSYFLKHVVERGIGTYVGNGELKGAMLKAGFTPTKVCASYDINWEFVLQRRLGNR